MAIAFPRPSNGALFLYEKGLKVFPCKPNEKTPAFPGWQAWATSATIEKIENFGKANPIHNWAVFAGASDILVVDLDNKPGKDGIKNFKAFLGDRKLPKTLTVRTPSGGVHMYFKCKGSAKSTVEALAKGVDTRGIGGYVVAPGSRLDETHYEIESETVDIAELPEFILSALNEIKKAPAKTIAEDDLIPDGERNATLASFAGTMRRRGANYDTVLAALIEMNAKQVANPLPEADVMTIAKSICRYAPEHAEAAADFAKQPTPSLTSTSAEEIDPNKIPKRDWIMKGRYVGGFISVIVAPGGVGKSALTMLDAVAIATGKPLTGFEIIKPGPVWIYNTEDPGDELKRRLAAISMHHEIPLSEMKGVRFSSGREQPLIIAKQNSGEIIVNKEAIAQVIEHITTHGVRLFIVDPFIGVHDAPENDNTTMNRVVWAFSHIAEKTGCAIAIVHHTRKAGANGHQAGNAEDARGASALIAAARIAHTLSPMSEDDAKAFCVDPERRGWYMRLDSAKANIQAPAERADWFEKQSVTLLNGDTVGTVECANMKDTSVEIKKAMQTAEVRDLAAALDTIMDVGTKMTIRDAFGQINTDPKWAHVFNNQTERKGPEEMMAKLKAHEPMHGGKVFKYSFDKDALRIKHWVVCERLPDWLA